MTHELPPPAPLPRRAVCALLALAVALLAGCERPTNAYVPPPPPEVTVAPPVRRMVQDIIECTGLTRGVEAVEVRARVKGFIAEKHIKGGERVQAGALLYKIDPRTFEAAVAQATAEVTVHEAELRLADATVDRITRARERDAVSAQDVDKARAERDAAAAAVDLARAQLAAVRLDLEFTDVRSPISGRVGVKTLDMGQLVGANEATLLATVVREDVIVATYSLDEARVLELRRASQNRRPGEDGRPNLTVLMALGDDPEFRHHGTFRSADNSIDPSTGTLTVEAEFDNASGDLMPGYYVRLQAILGESEALLVPDAAVQADATGRFVLVVNEQDVVERRDVLVGRATERMRVIAGGLDPSARVIVNGILRARPGARVVPIAAGAANG